MNSTEKRIAQCLSAGEYEYAEKICERAKEKTKEIVILRYLFDVFHQEEEHGAEDLIFDSFRDYKLLVEHFVRLKLLLRRLEYSISGEEEFFYYCERHKVSVYFVRELIRKNMFYPERVCRKLIEKYSTWEWKDEKKLKFYEELLKQLEETADE